MEAGSRPTIAVVSGSYGAGHDAVARELATRFLGTGARVTEHDVAGLLACGTGLAMRWAYFRQLQWFPTTWGITVTKLDADNRACRVGRSLLSQLGSRLVWEVSQADLIISTHPFASQILGTARARGQLGSPVVTYLTDASVHRFWVSSGVDLHLAIHDVAASQVRAMGAPVVVIDPVIPAVVGPLIPDDWSPPWPADRRVALIVGGSHGIGQLERTAKDVLTTGLMTPVVACGDNDRLRRRLARLPGTVALGWRSDLRALMAVADCVIQNSGGMSSLEALAAMTPTLTYHPIPGHGLTNALSLDRAGLVPFLEGIPQLRTALDDVVLGVRRRWLPERAADCLDTIAVLLPDADPCAPVVAA
jgi:processive 1,2-diacylglycerol beta-glucosyltransferase